MAGRGTEPSLRIISASLVCASRTICGIIWASGRLAQYFLGISARMAAILSRAGLKIDA